MTKTETPTTTIANDNAGGRASIALPARPSITVEELKMLQPVIEALVRMAANDLCATTLCCEEA